MRILSTLPRALPTAAEIQSGRLLTAPLQLETDVVVIGSGAGGGMLALKTSQAGLRTVVLEEGGNHSPAEVNQREGDMLPRLFQDRGGRSHGLRRHTAGPPGRHVPGPEHSRQARGHRA